MEKNRADCLLLNNCMSNARTMVGVIKGNTDASYDANGREKCMTEKKNENDNKVEKYTHMVVGTTICYPR